MAVTGKLDRYRLISTLGAGGMGTVVLAEDELLGRRVALKRMNAGGDAHGLSRLRREALIGASVSHPNLVSIYDIVTTEDGDQVIVMEYVRGETLSEALRREGKLSESEALRVLVGVSRALDAIHRQGIVHRDVKPANILLGAEGLVKLADLGIASTLDGTRVTTSGAVLGSFRYMAPEQLEGNPSTPAIDIYALSAVAYEALSGCKARQEPNPVALAHAIATQPPPDLRRVLPSVPVEAATLLSRGMARDPARRARSAGELVRRLQAALTPEAIPPVVVSPPRRAVPVAPTRRAAAVPLARPQRVLSSTRREPGARPRGPAATYTIARSRRPVAAALIGFAAVAAALAAILTSASSQPERQHSRKSTPANQQKPANLARGSTPTAGHGSTRPTHRSLSRATSETPSSGSAAPSTSRGSPSLATTGASAAARPATPSSTLQRTSAALSAGSSVSPSAPGTSAGPSTSAADGPISAVESFYGRAAAHQYVQAWALADPSFRNQLEGYDSFQAQQANDRSIVFNAAQVLSESSHDATVAVSTTSIRADGTKHCSGTVDLSRAASSGGWLLHLIHISCS